MIRRPPRSTQSRSSAASDVYKRQLAEDDDLDLLIQPIFEGNTARSTLEMTCTGIINDTEYDSTLTVKDHSDPYKVAGAIAGRVRDNERVALIAVGPTSVFHAVEAVAVAMGYLEDDRIDLKFCPKFVQVQNGDLQSTGLSLLVLAKNIQ
eukprot:TRINITY_DN2606_c0_g1_i1.p1 TRINITY_DN2606_c0_g1~~TRINITY_DN2606_c0_g1_i1.p1  ORF type:complete len:150 (+),score=61.32 TRINITY_DN2606_c0_g1_i1:65-514(+)